jgi:hypothetical protein
MPWELEVSDRFTSWGFGIKRFRPGIHPVVYDVALVDAVKRAPPGIALYEVGEALREPRFFSGDAPPSGVFELKDLKNPVTKKFKCKIKDCPADEFSSLDALRAHRERYHAKKE